MELVNSCDSYVCLCIHNFAAECLFSPLLRTLNEVNLVILYVIHKNDFQLQVTRFSIPITLLLVLAVCSPSPILSLTTLSPSFSSPPPLPPSFLTLPLLELESMETKLSDMETDTATKQKELTRAAKLNKKLRDQLKTLNEHVMDNMVNKSDFEYFKKMVDEKVLNIDSLTPAGSGKVEEMLFMCQLEC